MNKKEPSQKKRDLISFVVPAMDEEMTIEALYEGIAKVMADLPWDFELIFIDDGSKDRTWEEMEKLAKRAPQVRALRFRRNAGKATALAEGFQRAKGELVFTMDADLQDDPKEIPRFIEKIAEGFDVVTGYKKKRHDPWHKVWPSRIFNRMLNLVAGTDLHDHNCGFKCYRGDVIKKLKPYGEMHRMLAILANFEGYRVGEIVVEHHARKHGVSKYGFNRFLRGFMDLLTVGFLGHYGERPMHLAGIVSIFFVLLSTVLGLTGLGLVLGGFSSAYALIVTAFVFVAGIFPLLSVGLTAELLISGRFAYVRRGPVIADSGTYYTHKDTPENPISQDTSSNKADALVTVRSEDDGNLGPVADWYELLIVDDSSFAREYIKETLMDSGLRLEEANDGVEALEKINEHSAVVLLDLSMPRMNGFEFLEQVRRINDRALVIVVSGMSEVDDVVKVMKVGAFDYLTKPIQPTTLRKAVNRALREYQGAGSGKSRITAQL